ncbi:flagellar hook-length control protein FliK [Hyphomonas sp.]|uniref:flagellar hook-length control protein FliK n=1 Tax=Hyphomonas sp. TaxID=87 RepID=UPI00391BB696
MSAGDPAAALDLQGAAPVFTTAPGAAPLMAPVTAGMPSGAAPAMATFVAVPAEIPAIFARAVQDPAGDRITIQLDPPELGRISIDFRFEGSALQHVTVTAETPEALRQLRQMHGELISALEQNGLGGKDMTFQQQTPQDRPQQDAPAGATARRQPEMIAVPGLTAPDAAGPRALAAGRLDIRL